MDTALRPAPPATEALAEWCDDAEMSRAYRDLAAKWKVRAAWG